MRPPLKSKFLEAIASEHGYDNALSLKFDFFLEAGMPLPQQNGRWDPEWFNSTDSGKMLFLDDVGIILRMRSARDPAPNHPNILQPIATRSLGIKDPKIALEFIPGVETHPDWKKVREIEEILNKAGYHFWDSGSRNAGLLPTGEPVVIDIGAVEQLSFSVARIKRLLPGHAVENPQSEIYGDLIAAFEQAWPEYRETPRDMDIFWQACKNAKDDGLLKTGWQSNRTYGQTYSMRWRPEF